MKFLIAGLGNIGIEYDQTRHNVGFDVLDLLASEKEVSFTPDRLGDVCVIKHRGRTYHLLKPSTYVNRSGKAVKYWLEKLKIPPKNLLVIIDDLALPLGKIRIRKSGSDGGHNGLKDIEAHLQSRDYPRLRFGIGNEFSQGQQVNYVLGTWTDEERAILKERYPIVVNAILDLGVIGLERTMNTYNSK